MREKLLRIRSPWRRLLITVLVDLLIQIERLPRPRPRIHWIGSHRRPRRRERLLIVFLFVSAMLCLNADDYAYWSTLAGGMVSIFLVLYTIYICFPRRRAHWI